MRVNLLEMSRMHSRCPDTDNDKDRFGHALGTTCDNTNVQLLLSLLRKYVRTIRYGTLILRVDYNVLINYFEIASNTKREVNRRFCFCCRVNSKDIWKNYKIASDYFFSLLISLFPVLSIFRNHHVTKESFYNLHISFASFHCENWNS